MPMRIFLKENVRVKVRLVIVDHLNIFTSHILEVSSEHVKRVRGMSGGQYPGWSGRWVEQPQQQEQTIVKQEMSKQEQELSPGISDNGPFYDGYQSVNTALGPEYYPGHHQYMSAAQYVAASSYSSALNYGYHHPVAAGAAGHTHQHTK